MNVKNLGLVKVLNTRYSAYSDKAPWNQIIS